MEKFKAVVKDILKETALDATAGQSQVLEETVAADQTQSAEAETNYKETTDKDMETEGNSL